MGTANKQLIRDTAVMCGLEPTRLERDGLQEKDADWMHVLAFGDFEKGRQEEQKPGKASCWTVSV